MQAIEWLRDYEFARQAMVTGVAVATACSILSVVVVLKRMAFIGEGVSHAGFGGVGTAVFLGLSGMSQDVVVMAFCLAAAVGIGVLSGRRQIEPDSAIGIMLVAAMAWGVFMDNLSLNMQGVAWYVRWFGERTLRPSYEQMLFGSLMNSSRVGMWIAIGSCVMVVGVCGAMFKEILFFTFDEQVSRVYGVPARWIHFLLLVMLSVTVVVSIRLAGFVLVSALLVIPGAAALQVSSRLSGVLLWSWSIGLVGVVGGLLISLEAGNISSGPCIVGVLSAIFLGTLVWRSLMSRWRHGRA